MRDLNGPFFIFTLLRLIFFLKVNFTQLACLKIYFRYRNYVN